MISLMHALDPLAHHTEINLYLNKLINIDPLRANYYADLRKNVTPMCFLNEGTNFFGSFSLFYNLASDVVKPIIFEAVCSVVPQSHY